VYFRIPGLIHSKIEKFATTTDNDSNSIETPRLSDRILSSVASSNVGLRITNQETS